MSPLKFNALVPPFDEIGIGKGEPAELLNAAETTENFTVGTEEWKPKAKFQIYEAESTIASVSIGGIEPPAEGERNFFFFRNNNTVETRTFEFKNKSAGAKAGWELSLSSGEPLELKAKQSVLLWYDSTLKAWVNLNAVPGENTVTNAMVKVGANIALSKVEEGTNLVKLSGEQTITGKKLFKPPTPAESVEEIEEGLAGTEAIEVAAGQGQQVKNAILGTTTGGAGAKVKIATGAGGEGKNTSKSTGSAAGSTGGKLELLTGKGGGATATETSGSSKGGEGGGFTVIVGEGGSGAGEGTGERIGGAGGLVRIQGGEGGKGRQSTGVRKAGAGSSVEITAGKGGVSEGNKGTSTTSGAGGEVIIKSGAGGTSGSTEVETVVAEGGGPFTIEAGAGGVATGTLTGTRQGGAGGAITVKAGAGGAASVGSGTRTGGAGAKVEIAAGAGGNAGTTGGAGGEIVVKSGNAGTGATPSGGAITITCGNASTDALSGNFVIKTGKVAGGTTRLTINGEGNALFEKGIGVFKHAAPAAAPASIKPEEITVKVAMERIDKVFKEYGLTE